MPDVKDPAGPGLVQQLPLVVFELEDRLHALPLELVVEVLRMVEVTPIPDSPAWLLGMIDLRGRTIPVLDLRTRLGFQPREPGLATPILVAEASGEHVVGLVADALVEMRSLAVQSVESLDERDGIGVAAEGVAHDEGRLVVVLALDAIADGTRDLLAGAS